MNISKLLGNRILVEPLPDETTAKNGLHLPQSVQKKQAIGIVRMIGTGNGNAKMAVVMALFKVGQKVHCDLAHGHVDTTFDGKPMRIHSLHDIQAIVG